MACDPEQEPLHRYITTEHINAGDIILEEEPWTWSLFCLHGETVPGPFKDGIDGPHEMICHYCFKTERILSPAKLQICSACRAAWYCGAACQRADWTLRHKHGDCRMQKAIMRLGDELRTNSLQDAEFRVVIRRLLLHSASARLFSAKQHDPSGKPLSPLWHALLDSPSKTDDWAVFDRKLCTEKESPMYAKLAQLITWKDLPDKLIEKRILPSLVILRDYGMWKKQVETIPFSTDFRPPAIPPQFALGACLEMSKFSNDCNPNAVVVNEGRLIRMVALESIPNLGAVRLARMPGWHFETRLTRRAEILRGVFGYDCYCARCCAGDSGETTLLGLRCPKWAARYDTETGDGSKCGSSAGGCDGVVTGLRRTDIEINKNNKNSVKNLTELHGADIVAAGCLDEPRPLPAGVMNAPAHERAQCNKCHARYDKKTMNKGVLLAIKTLCGMNPAMCKWITKPGNGAEQYIYPSNYLYIYAKQLRFGQCSLHLDDGSALDTETLLWLQRFSREMIARIQRHGFKQVDLVNLFDVVGMAAYCLRHMRRSNHGRGNQSLTVISDHPGQTDPYTQTVVLLNQMVLVIMQKLRLVLVHD